MLVCCDGYLICDSLYLCVCLSVSVLPVFPPHTTNQLKSNTNVLHCLVFEIQLLRENLVQTTLAYLDVVPLVLCTVEAASEFGEYRILQFLKCFLLSVGNLSQQASE